RAERPHRERNDIHHAPLHRATEESSQYPPHLGRLAPVVRRTGVELALATDERAVLDTCDVAWVRAREEGARATLRIERLERARLDEHTAELLEGRRGTVEPAHAVPPRERSHLLDPGQQPGVLGRRHGRDHAATPLQMS